MNLMNLMTSRLLILGLVLVVATSNLSSAQTPPSPGQSGFCSDSSPRIRKEFRDWTDAEWNRYVAAARALLNSGGWTLFVQLHDQQFDVIHGTPFFLPWHRRYIYELETALRTFDSSVTLPYWDSGLDAASPISSPMMTGTQRNPYWSQLGRSSSPCLWSVSYPDRHCLARTPDSQARLAPATFVAQLASGQPVLDYSRVPSSIANALRSGCRLRDGTGYAMFGCLLELVHSYVHVFVGGDMAQSISANDPLFFLHHAYIDKVWQDRQLSNNGRLAKQYGGTFNGAQVTGQTRMPFYNTPVSSVFPTTQCVVYQPRRSRNGASTARLLKRSEEWAQLMQEARDQAQKEIQNEEQQQRNSTILEADAATTPSKDAYHPKIIELASVSGYHPDILQRPVHARPEPLSESWMRRMKYNPEVIRALEYVMNVYIDEHNLRVTKLVETLTTVKEAVEKLKEKLKH